MPKFIQGVPRTQVVLFPDRLEDWVLEDSIARVIDAFVAGLNLIVLGFVRAVPPATGRPAYDPADLLRLHLYGYVNGIGSSRKLEHAARTNVELMWLLRRLTPDFKTIAEFRRLNGPALKQTLQEMVRMMLRAGVVQARLIAIDGTALIARGSRRSVVKEDLPGVEEIAADITRHLAALDAADAADREREGDDLEGQQAAVAGTLKRLAKKKAGRKESAGLAAGEQLDQAEEPDAQERAEAQAALQAQVQPEAEEQPKGGEQSEAVERREEASGPEAGAKAGKGRWVSRTDPESCLMPHRVPNRQPCWNGQVAVDTATGLVLAVDLAPSANETAMAPGLVGAVVARCEEAQVPRPEAVVADAGYGSAEAAVALERMGVEAVMPRRRGAPADGVAFEYDAEQDLYRCPQGAELRRVSRRPNKDGQLAYAARAGDCGVCPIKARCTKGSRRSHYRHMHEAVVAAMQERWEQRPEARAARWSSVERTIGQIKTVHGPRRVLQFGRVGALADMDLRAMAFNMVRLVNAFGAAAAMALVSGGKAPRLA